MPLNDKKQRLMDQLETEKEHIRRSTAEMSAELKRLLENEIEAFQQRDRHRCAEMIAIFAKHNFYTNGFTPQELRTTLEDLGPTYVKIGQIMSSRVDLLPSRYCKELEKLRENVKPPGAPNNKTDTPLGYTREILTLAHARSGFGSQATLWSDSLPNPVRIPPGRVE